MTSFWRKREVIIDIVIALLMSLLINILNSYLPGLYLHFDTLINVSVTLIGFQITAITILVTFTSTKDYSPLKEFTGHPTFTQIFLYFIFDIISFLISFIIGLIGLFNSTPSSNQNGISNFTQNGMFGFIFYFFFFLGILGLIGGVWMIKLIIEIIHPTTFKDNKDSKKLLTQVPKPVPKQEEVDELPEEF